jgi:O-antigen/teichoic acid export membrane protein
MSQLKKLASQTLLYGLSNIMAKMLNYLLTPLLSYLLINQAGQIANGNMAIIYSSMTFFNIIFTYGMETAYFKFSNQDGIEENRLFQTSLTSLIISTVFLCGVVFFTREWLSNWMSLEQSIYINFMFLIIAIDTIAVIPFAKLRQEQRPLKYAITKLLGILVTIGFTLWFIVFSPSYIIHHPESFYTSIIQPYDTTSLLLLSNVAGSFITLLLLIKEWKGFRFNIDINLWKKIIGYSLPFIIIGLGGMINEVIDRIMLSKLYVGTVEEAKSITATYNFSYKLAIFITLFIQAFKMAAEPFFFNQSKEKNAPETYAKVMYWFVITLCVAFLFTSLFIDGFKYFIGPQYRQGLGVVPILLSANVCLGIYYNLSVWYKITDNLKYGIAITLFGAALTLSINFYFIPSYGMYASAYATLICYGTMMILSYFLGQKFYSIPYKIKSIGFYVLMAAICFICQYILSLFISSVSIRLLTGFILLGIYLILIVKKESVEILSLLKKRNH